MKTTEFQPHLIHPLFFQEEISAQLNFPFWFNDSLIAKNKISQISYTVYQTMIEDSVENVPQEKKNTIFTFNKQGILTHIQSVDFYEGIIIQSISYSLSKPNTFGYSKVEMTNKQTEIETTPTLYSLKEITDQSMVVSSSNKDKLIYIFNHNYFGPLSVDSIARPKPNDWIVLGKPNKPKKRYKVKNTVRESYITTYSYFTKNYPKKISSEDYPFIKKRFFIYQHGLLSQYTDSIYVDRQFVTNVVTNVNYKNNLPVEVKQKKIHNENKTQSTMQLAFKYTFFE